MKTVLLPVKDFRQAKQRLAPAFTPAQRAGIAQAMFSDVLAALAGARRPDRVIIYTASEDVAKLVRPYSFDIHEELFVNGHSAAVNRLVDDLTDRASHILSIASDLPLISSADIDTVFESATEGVAFVGSRDGTGTNAALFVRPARVKMEYGDGSLSRHLSSAAAAGVQANVLRVPGIEFDIDTPDDFQSYVQHGPNPSQTWRYIASL